VVGRRGGKVRLKCRCEGGWGWRGMCRVEGRGECEIRAAGGGVRGRGKRGEERGRGGQIGETTRGGRWGEGRRGGEGWVVGG